MVGFVDHYATLTGNIARKFCISFCVIKLPVGLLGLQM